MREEGEELVQALQALLQPLHGGQTGRLHLVICQMCESYTRDGSVTYSLLEAVKK